MMHNSCYNNTMKITNLYILGSIFITSAILPSCGAAHNANQPTAWWEEGNNPKKINTAGWEDSPYITPDGNNLYFMYTPYNFFPMFLGGKPQKIGPDRSGHKDSYNGNPWLDSDTYICERKSDGTWSVPKNCNFNTHYGDACGMPGRSGKTFYYLTQTKPQPVEPNLHIVKKKADGSWGKPTDLGIGIERAYRDDNPHVSADEKIIWFTSTRTDGHGKKDIWVTKKEKDGIWSKPENMSSAINTDEDEDQIWVSKDGKTSFFNRGMHIYRSKKKSGKWLKAERVDFGSEFMAAEVSLTEDMQTMVYMLVDPLKKDIFVVKSRNLGNNKWSEPVRLD